MQIVFATQNPNKYNEVKTLLPKTVNLFNLQHYKIIEELPETHDTLEENALEKARYVAENYSTNCFADDTGLEVTALDGKPGVFSARYAGEEKNALSNMKKLLHEMEGITNRSAQFRTVIALYLNGKEYLFEGVVEGIILTEMRGDHGFGYDPIFQPTGFNRSFAEMTLEEKNKLSHRARAFEKLIRFINENEALTQ